MEFKEECQTRGVHLTLEAPENQEINIQVEVTWRTLRKIAHSLMIHARVSEAYIHFAFMYTTVHIFPVLPIKDMIKKVASQQPHLNLQNVQNLHYQI